MAWESLGKDKENKDTNCSQEMVRYRRVPDEVLLDPIVQAAIAAVSKLKVSDGPEHGDERKLSVGENSMNPMENIPETVASAPAVATATTGTISTPPAETVIGNDIDTTPDAHTVLEAATPPFPPGFGPDVVFKASPIATVYTVVGEDTGKETRHGIRVEAVNLTVQGMVASGHTCAPVMTRAGTNKDKLKTKFMYQFKGRKGVGKGDSILGKCDNGTRRRILLLMWRAWWLRDDCIHAYGKALIGQSVCFLVKYAEETRLGGDECVEHSEGGRWANHQENDPVNQRRMEIREGKKPQGQRFGEVQMIKGRGELHTGQSNPLILGQKQDVRSKWEPPDKDWWKLNTNASFIANTGDTTAGIIVRTHEGMVAMACGQRMHACMDPEQAELAVVLYWLLVLSKYYRGPMNVESDCASIVLLLNSKGTNQSCHFPLIADVEHIKKEFKEVTFRFINRTSNKLAHELAALARIHGDYFKLGDVPPSLRSILREDCNCSLLNL
ncbi:hypothetical protein D1007_15927 [Hordeum vulgare]|nr:hypothetical protein D1007_15927 [Hordeum vulgare]